MLSACTHAEVVNEYLHTEISLGRVAGPFPSEAIQNGHISRFGVIPNNHQPNKWRLIVDLSYPTGHSVNDRISPPLCTLHYVTTDDAVNQIFSLGRGYLLAKIDIQSTFRLLPVHPVDRHLLLIKWNDKVYVDTCLPFGLCAAPKLFNILADLLEWIARAKGVHHILHYLDDFLILGPPTSLKCQLDLDTIIKICKDLESL